MSYKIKLTENEMVVCAYAEKASGPGWSNCPVFVVIENKCTCGIRTECIQMDQQSEEMLTIYDIAAEVHETMLRMAKMMVKVNARKDG